MITAVILVIAEFCSPYALVLEQEKRKQKALEERKKEIAQMRKACIDKKHRFFAENTWSKYSRSGGSDFISTREK